MALLAAAFDVGETLFCEERSWEAWATWLGVPAWTLAAALGETIERRDDHRTAFEVVRPGFDLASEQAARACAEPVGDEAEGRPALHRDRVVRMVGEPEHHPRLVAVPLVAGRSLPSTTAGRPTRAPE